MSQQRTLLAAMLGLIGMNDASLQNAPLRPSVDDVWKHAASAPTRFRYVPSRGDAKRAKKKRLWRIERDSRKVNYARNGTRG